MGGWMPHDRVSCGAAESTGIKHWRERIPCHGPAILELQPLPHFLLPICLLGRHSLALVRRLTRASCHSSNVATGLEQTRVGPEGGALLV